MRAMFHALLLLLCAMPAFAQQGIVQQPGGRLTLITHTPVLPILQDFPDGSGIVQQDITTSTVYYDAFVSRWVPYYNGTSDVMDSIANGEVSLTMATSSTGVTNTAGVFDIFWSGAFHKPCVVTNGSGGGWASDTATATQTGNTHTTTTVDGLTNVVAAGWWIGMGIAESHGDIPANTVIVAIGADGTSVTLSAAATASHTGGTITVTGASNQERGFGYSRVHNTRGYWTNVNALTHCYNGATDYGSISADQGTYLGTLYTTAAGTTTVKVKQAAGGGNSIIGIWNAYNRVMLTASENDLPSGNITVTSATFAYLDSSANNRVSWVDGLQQSILFAGVSFFATNSGGSEIRVCEIIDWQSGRTGPGNCAGGDSTFGEIYYGVDTHQPYLGFHFMQLVQQNANGSGTGTIPSTTNPGGGIWLPM